MPPPPRPSLLTDARTDEPLLWLTGADRQRVADAGYYYDAAARQDRPHVVLQLTLRGVGFYRRQGGPRLPLPAGRAFLDRIPGPFEYGWAEGAYELVFVSMAGESAGQWAELIHRRYGPVLELGQDAAVAQTMLGLVAARRRGALNDRYLLSGQLYGLLMQVLSVLSRSRIAATPMVAECLRLVQQDAADPRLNVNALAERLGRSREHLTREFTEAIGVSPSTYLTQTRVRLAAGHLRAGSDKLNAVAGRSGFGSAEYLCRVFRRSVGVTPEQFRQRPWLAVP